MALPPPLVGTVDPAVDLAAAAVRDYCGWHIAPSFTETRRVSARGGRDFLLPTLMLTNVTTTTSDLVAVVVTEWEEIGVVRYPSGQAWSGKMRGVEITFTHGYTACPPALVGVIESMATRGVTSLGVSRTQVGQVSRMYLPGGSEGALGGTEAEMDIVRRYRIPQTQ